MKKETLDHGTVFWADQQTKGRGQMGNNWRSSAGMNLTLTAIIKPRNIAADQLFVLNMMTSLAVCKTVTDFGIELCRIKWPNDILVDEGKIAGLLIENTLSASKLEFSAIGIGLNVNQMIFEGLPHAVSMKQVSGRDFQRKTVLNQMLGHLNTYYSLLEHGKINELRSQYLSLLLGYQELRLYKDRHSTFSGQILGVDESGQLKMEVSGEMRTYSFKEVQLIGLSS